MLILAFTFAVCVLVVQMWAKMNIYSDGRTPHWHFHVLCEEMLWLLAARCWRSIFGSSCLHLRYFEDSLFLVSEDKFARFTKMPCKLYCSWSYTLNIFVLAPVDCCGSLSYSVMFSCFHYVCHYSKDCYFHCFGLR